MKRAVNELAGLIGVGLFLTAITIALTAGGWT